MAAEHPISDRNREARAKYDLGLFYWGEGRQDVAVANFEDALEFDPELAERPYREGLERACAGEFAEAEGWLWLGHLFRPKDAATLGCLGDVLRRLGRVEEALPLVEQAVTLAPESWEVQADLGLVLLDLDRMEEAGAAMERAVSLHGMDARLALNLAMIRKAEGRPEEALRLLEDALFREPGFAAARVNRAHLLLMAGRLEEGWDDYEFRPQKSLVRRLPNGHVVGKTILLHQEQGAGDLIQFIRYAALLKDAQVTVSCDERFIPLMRNAAGVGDAVSWNEPLPKADFEANVMSLPQILGADFRMIAVPYLEIPEERVEAWRARMAGEQRLRVGVVWGGNPLNPVERRRRISLARLAALFDGLDVAFYSLQQGPQRSELANVPGLVDLSGDCADVLEAGAAMMNLDLILTTDTMPAHLAGALGRPVWVLLHFMADWRWLLEREDSEWYPSMRLFRQTRPGDWDGVVKRVAEELRLLGLRHHGQPDGAGVIARSK